MIMKRWHGTNPGSLNAFDDFDEYLIRLLMRTFNLFHLSDELQQDYIEVCEVREL